MPIVRNSLAFFFSKPWSKVESYETKWRVTHQCTLTDDICHNFVCALIHIIYICTVISYAHIIIYFYYSIPEKDYAFMKFVLSTLSFYIFQNNVAGVIDK